MNSSQETSLTPQTIGPESETPNVVENEDIDTIDKMGNVGQVRYVVIRTINVAGKSICIRDGSDVYCLKFPLYQESLSLVFSCRNYIPRAMGPHFVGVN